MMKFPSILAALLFVFSSAGGQEPVSAAVGKEVTAVIKALYKPDYDLILKHTHAKVLEVTGGEEVFLDAMKQVHEALKEGGVRITGVEIGKEIDYFAGAENEFLLVPVVIAVTSGENKANTPGYQLGVKKKGGAVWKYIDCSALNDELVRQWFPDFPKDKTIPKG